MLVLQRGKFTERDSEISRVLARTASLFPRFFIPRYVSPELFSSSFSPSFLSSSFSLFISRFLVAFCDISQGRGIVIKSELWARAGQLDSIMRQGNASIRLHLKMSSLFEPVPRFFLA